MYVDCVGYLRRPVCQYRYIHRVPVLTIFSHVTCSSMSTGSFDDSVSDHSSTGTVNHTAPPICPSLPSSIGGFSPLTALDTYSTTTTDSESDMFDSTPNSNNNNSSSNSTSRTVESESIPSSCSSSASSISR